MMSFSARIIRLPLTAILIIVSVCAWADPYRTGSFQFRHLLTMDGGFLGPGRITSIAQDKQGYIWIGGDNGLARYDGKRFRMFNYDAQDPHSLSADSIRDLEVDATGNLWVVTSAKTAALLRYDAQQEIFVRYDTEKISPITSIDSDSRGTLYLAAYTGVKILVKDSLITQPMVFEYRDITQTRRAIEVHGEGIFIDRLDRLWVREPDNGLSLFDQKNHAYRSWRKNIGDSSSIDSDNVRDIYQDHLGQIWVTTGGGGVSRIAADLNSITTFRHVSSDQESLGGDLTSSVTEDRNGKIWVVTDNAGVSIFHPDTQKFTQLKSNRQDSASLKSDSVQIIFKDHAQDLWLVQYPLGVDYLNMDGYEVIRKLADPENTRSLSNNGILTIKKDHNGEMWIGTEEGLNWFHDKANDFKQFVKISNSRAGDLGLKSNTILSIEEDIDQSLWLGTYGGGLHNFDADREIIHHYPNRPGPGGYSGNIVWSLLRDSNNTLWVGGNDGLARYDRSSDSFTYYRELKTKIPNNDIVALAEFSPGKILIGTYWGLHLFNSQSETLESVSADNPFFPDENIASIAKLTDGNFWIGTDDGIVIMDNQRRPIGRISTEQGLPAKAIAALFQARDGMVWATTSSGVAVIDPQTKQIKVLHQYHGLACDNYERNAISEDAEGNIFLGGTAGLSKVVTQPFLDSSQPEKVIINGLTVMNRRVYPNTSKSPLNKPIAETNHVELAHDQNVFSLELTNLNFKVSHRLEYEYKLEGLDSDWSNADENSVASFANLKSGDYRFIARVKQPGGEPSVETVLDITVKSEPWLSTAAKLIYFMIIILGIYWVNAFRHVRAKKMEAERMATAKTEFFATMSHEIRTPLAGVLGMLSFALKDKRIDRKSAGQLNIAKANAEVLLEITNDILDLTKIEAGKLQLETISFDLIALLLHEVGLATVLADEKDISVSFDVATDVPQYLLGDPVRVGQVLNKLLNNAVKFTKSGSIILRVRLLPKISSLVRVSFAVEDTGIGIEESSIDNLFKKFTQVDVSTSRIYGGTGLGLAICKQLVDLMAGEISVTSELGRGSVFQVIIPFLAKTSGAESESKSRLHSHQLSILCAEDFTTNQLIVRSLVEEMGHKITIVESGVAAIEALIDQQYDLVLMDGRMPKMDGAQAASIIRGGTWNGRVIAQAKIPIIALTANTHGDQNSGYLKAGMNDIVMKPIDSSVLFYAIDKVIKTLLNRGYSLAVMPSSRSSEVIDSVTSGADLDELFGVANFSAANAGELKPAAPLEQLSFDEKLILAFKTNLPVRQLELQAALAENDFETLGRVFHGIKGSAAHFGDEVLRQICFDLEQAADTANVDFILEQFPTFELALQAYQERSSS